MKKTRHVGWKGGYFGDKGEISKIDKEWPTLYFSSQHMSVQTPQISVFQNLATPPLYDP